MPRVDHKLTDALINVPNLELRARFGITDDEQRQRERRLLYRRYRLPGVGCIVQALARCWWRDHY